MRTLRWLLAFGPLFVMGCDSGSANRQSPSSLTTKHSALRVRFVSAAIDQPQDWGERYAQGAETPDPYVVAFLNGEPLFVTPPDAVIADSYAPEWNVLMPRPFAYNPERGDEFTILVLDSDTDIAKQAFAMISRPRFAVAAGISEDVGVQASLEFELNEQTFNEDDRLGRWSGKIPHDVLTGPANGEWELSFDRVASLRMVVEKCPLGE